MARVLEGLDGVRFRSTFKAPTVVATIRSSRVTSARTILQRERCDLPIPAEEAAAYRCGCTQHGVITIEVHVLTDAIALYRQTGTRQTIAVTIVPLATEYRLE
jgi:hypothetical protein